jgi:uncharacterized protein YcfL
MMKVKVLMVILTLALLFVLTACQGEEPEVEVMEEEIVEEVQADSRGITAQEAAVLLVERVISADVHREFERYFYDVDGLQSEIEAQFEAHLLPHSVREDMRGMALEQFMDNLDEFTDNIINALNERTAFDVIDVEELEGDSYAVTLAIYGLDYDHMAEIAIDSAFYWAMMQIGLFTAGEDEIDLLDFDFEGFFDGGRNTGDYLVKLSETVRTTPISKEVVVTLEYIDGVWHLINIEDIDYITQALLVERGYVLESDEPLQRLDGEPDSILIRRLLDDTMREFEEINAVSVEQERYLAFGAFLLTNNQESARIMAIGNSALHAGRILRDFWGVTDGESAMIQIIALAEGRGQALVANEIWNEVILTENVTLDDIWYGRAFDYLEYTTNATRNAAMSIFENAMADEELLEYLDDEYYLDGLTVEEYVYEAARRIALEERVHSGVMAFNGASEMLIDLFDFTRDELFEITTLVAWDYGRVAIVARYAVAAGFLDEDDVWPYLEMAANSASETYSGWREFTAAHIIGRAVAFGSDSSDFIYALDFLLNHSESPFQRIDF